MAKDRRPKFKGSIDDLKALIASLGVIGEWEVIEHGHQFRSDDDAVLCWFTSTGTMTFQGPTNAAKPLEARVVAAIGGAPLADVPVAAHVVARDSGGSAPRVFVVHGHDSTSREQLELVLHKLGLNPFVLANTGGGGLTIIEALEKEIGRGKDAVRFGIVLMTPDDMGFAKSDGPDRAQPRARQNVVLEMGMLISAIGRDKVAVLRNGHLEIPSDAQGILYIPFSNHVREVVPKLVDRLQKAGFKLEPSRISIASS